MGRAIIIPNVSFATNNLGQVNFVMDSAVLKITALENLIILFTNNLKYSTKAYPDWNNYVANTIINVSSGTTVLFKGNLTPNEANGIGSFAISGNCTISGTPLALLENNVMTAHAFKGLFKNCTSISNASNLVLPTTLTEGCFEEMFYGCTSLTAIPTLSSTTLVTDCYKKMLYGCSSLNRIVCYNLNDISDYVDSDWVSGVANSGVFEIDYTGDWDSTNKASHIPSGWSIDDDYNKPYEAHYFTIDILSDGKFTLLNARQNYTTTWTSSNALSIDYKVNNGSWTTEQILDAGITLDVVAGDKIKFRGTNTHYCNNSGSSNVHKQWYVIFGAVTPSSLNIGDSVTYKNTFTETTATFNVYGNIMSLCYGDNFIGQTTLPATYTFCTMFKAAPVISAEHLILPATTMLASCYRAMFSCANHLTVGPVIPNATIATECYKYIYERCYAITKITCLVESSLVNSSTKAFECWSAYLPNTAAITFIKSANTSISSTGGDTAWLEVTAAELEGSTNGANRYGQIGSNWIVQDYVAAS